MKRGFDTHSPGDQVASPAESILVCCSTPLYQFDSDTDKSVISEGVGILPVREPIGDLDFDHVLRSHLAMCKPDRLVFQRSSLSSAYFRKDRLASSEDEERQFRI